MRVTKENAHDGMMLKELVSDVCNNSSSHGKKVLADGAYDIILKITSDITKKLSKNNTNHKGKKESVARK